MSDPRTMESRLRVLFHEVDQRTEDVARRSGIRCPPGCGHCCDNPRIDARVVEMMPAAMRALREGRAEQLHADATAAVENNAVCVFFQRVEAPPGGDKERTHGRCRAYEDRPTLCRLFGFAGFRDKRGEVGLAACPVHHQELPDVMDRAHDDVASGKLSLPIFSDVATRVAGEGGDSVTGPVPINRALKEALERAWLQGRGDR